VNPPDVEQSQAQDLSSKLEARPHLTNGEFQELEEHPTEYKDIFAGDNEDCGRASKVYHRIDTGDARPIRQPSRRIPLAKQAEVNDRLENMQRLGVIEESASPWSPPSFWSVRRMGSSSSAWTTGN
jgi:hypothetical protein